MALDAHRRARLRQEEVRLGGAMRIVARHTSLSHRVMLEPGCRDDLSDVLVTTEAQVLALGHEETCVVGRMWVVALAALSIGDDLVGALHVLGDDIPMTSGAELTQVARKQFGV